MPSRAAAHRAEFEKHRASQSRHAMLAATASHYVPRDLESCENHATSSMSDLMGSLIIADVRHPRVAGSLNLLCGNNADQVRIR